MANVIPYILSVFSNPPEGAPNHLPYVDAEANELQKLFDAVKAREGIILDYRPLTDTLATPVTPDFILNKIDEFKYLNTIIHYSGHATAATLTIQDTDLRSQNFIKRISLCEKLKVVVLNACSTQGFVRRILENTDVKAVIATPKPVRDVEAMKFAKEFYTKLTERYSLADAFTHAVSIALENAYEDNSYVIKTEMDSNYKIGGGELLFDRKDPARLLRGTKKNVAAILDDLDALSDWGLYTKSHEILDWKLYESMLPTEAQKEGLEDEKKSLNRAKLEAMARRDEQEEKLDKFKERLAREPDEKLFQDAIADIEKELLALKIEIDQKERLIKDIDLALSGLSEESRAEAIRCSYQENVKNLNYDEQRNYVKGIDDNDSTRIFKGFVLHGTPDCCLDYLSVKMAKWLGFSKVEKIIYDFASVAINDFWQQLRQRIPGLNDSEPKAIVQGLHNQFMADGTPQRDIVFLFRNITGKEGDENHAARIFAFWKQLMDLWPATTVSEDNQHHIYALLIDNRCELIAAPEFTSSREAVYKALVNNDQLFQNTISIVPVVRPLREGIITQWEGEFIPDTNDRYEKSELRPWLKETGGFFRPTIRTISKNKIKIPGKQEALLAFIRENIEDAQL